jgi:TIR domain-containing protein
MRAIFISYRRDDAEGQAGRLFDDLVKYFGQSAVFMDVTGIEPGRDFRRVIDEQVASCGVLLALIGKDWLDAKDQSGARRLDDPTDFVRLETASALKRDIPVVPVLVQGATMPRAEQLPDVLKELAYRNGVELTHARWDSDVDVLAKQLQRHVDPNPKSSGSSGSGWMSRRTAIVVALSLLAVAVAGWYFWPPGDSAADDAAVDAAEAQPAAADVAEAQPAAAEAESAPPDEP